MTPRRSAAAIPRATNRIGNRGLGRGEWGDMVKVPKVWFTSGMPLGSTADSGPRVIREFAAIFKVLPDAKVPWRDMWVGAIATAALFAIGKLLIGVDIGQTDPGRAFGAAGALALLFVWVYYAAVIVLLGAEFTQAWMRQHGRDIEPAKGAARVVERVYGAGEPRVADTRTEAPPRRMRHA
jgi:hypothetical protein